MSDVLGDILGGAEDTEPNDEDGRYRAYWLSRRAVVCELRSVHPVEHDINFAYIYDTMAYSGDYSFFWVVTSFFVVKVKGRHLRPVVRAIRARNVAWIQEFNKDKHKILPDPGEPVITHISVEIKPAGETFREASEGFKA